MDKGILGGLSVGGECFDGPCRSPRPATSTRCSRLCARSARALDQVAGVDPLFASVTEKQTLLVGADPALGPGHRAAGAGARGRPTTGGRVRRPDRGDLAGGRDPHLPPRSRPRRTARRRAAGAVARASARRWRPGGSPGSRPACWSTPSTSCPPTSTPSCGPRPRRTWSPRPGTSTPPQLRRLGRHVLEVVAPDVADATQRAALLAEEARARAAPGCRSGPAVTGPPTCTPGSPTTSPPGSGPTSTPTPHPAARPALDSDVDRLPAAAGAGGRRSAPSWSTSPPTGSRTTAAPRPR